MHKIKSKTGLPFEILKYMPFVRLHNKSHKSLLIVEDDFNIREALRMLLELEGYLVFTASSGAEALAKLRSLKPENKPCLILCDLMMPGMSGAEFANLMDEDLTLIGIPIAIMTASIEEVPGRRVIRKPFSIDLIIRLAHEACEKNLELLSRK